MFGAAKNSMYATGQAPKKSKTNCPRRYALHTLESSKMQTPCDVKIYINKHTSVPIEFCDTREATHTQTRQIHAYRILYCREKVNHNFQYEKSVCLECKDAGVTASRCQIMATNDREHSQGQSGSPVPPRSLPWLALPLCPFCVPELQPRIPLGPTLCCLHSLMVNICPLSDRSPLFIRPYLPLFPLLP